MTTEQPERPNKGFHPLLEQDIPYLFVDTCMQWWPDADTPNAHRHGVTAYAATAWDPNVTVDVALEGLMYFHLLARQNANVLIATSAADIRRAKAEGKAAIILAAQDGDFIGNKLHRVEAFYRLGLRMMLPAYNASNLICGGALDRADSGLTKFGELVVDECNRVGLLLDGTHIGRRSSLEMIERSHLPCVFSHSNPRGIVDNARNIDDEQIKACAAKGGVIGAVSWGPLVMKAGSRTRPTVDDFVGAIDYIAQLLGNSDHIGIGTDSSLGTYPDHKHDPWGAPDYFGGVWDEYQTYVTSNVRSPLRAVRGFSAYPEIVNVIARLQKRGYSERDVRGILGENFMRVFEQVWK
ncbi:MAG: membrane dipeptidase [Chloroflexi bacterium]|nr:membrane dipeptidase [Chloroflexota bacterium]